MYHEKTTEDDVKAHPKLLWHSGGRLRRDPMGREAVCAVTFDGKTTEAKALLESHEIVIRGTLKLKIPLSEARDVRVTGGLLQLSFTGGPVALELGTQAAAWAKRILSPPSRMDKLGIKAGQKIALVGHHDPAFAAELRTLTGLGPVTRPTAGTDLIFLEAPDRKALQALPRLASLLTDAGALWVLRPKGSPAISEKDVMEAGRATGLKDVKVVSFSETVTAEKFVIPLNQRKKGRP